MVRRDPLFEKYRLKDELTTEFKLPVPLNRPGFAVVNPQTHKDVRMWCPLCINLQIKARMYENKDKNWECPECHNVIDIKDLGLKPLQEDEIVAVNDPYLPKAKIYTPSNPEHKKLVFTRESIRSRKKGYKMFDRKEFDSVQEAMTSGL